MVLLIGLNVLVSSQLSRVFCPSASSLCEYAVVLSHLSIFYIYLCMVSGFWGFGATKELGFSTTLKFTKTHWLKIITRGLQKGQFSILLLLLFFFFFLSRYFSPLKAAMDPTLTFFLFVVSFFFFFLFLWAIVSCHPRARCYLCGTKQARLRSKSDFHSGKLTRQIKSCTKSKARNRDSS